MVAAAARELAACDDAERPAEVRDTPPVSAAALAAAANSLAVRGLGGAHAAAAAPAAKAHSPARPRGGIAAAVLPILLPLLLPLSTLPL